MSLEVIDIIFIIIILITGIGGFKKGFFSQIITAAGIVIGLILAYFFSDDLLPYISNITGEREWNNIFSFILIFIVVTIVTLLVNKLLESALENLGTENIDKMLGFIFGLVQGVFACVIVTIILTAQPFFDPDPIFRDSVIGSKIVSALPAFEEYIPSGQDFLDEIEIEL